MLFNDDFECRMAVDCLYRFGLLTRQWKSFNLFDVAVKNDDDDINKTQEVYHFSPPPTQKRIIIEFDPINEQETLKNDKKNDNNHHNNDKDIDRDFFDSTSRDHSTLLNRQENRKEDDNAVIKKRNIVNEDKDIDNFSNFQLLTQRENNDSHYPSLMTAMTIGMGMKVRKRKEKNDRGSNFLICNSSDSDNIPFNAEFDIDDLIPESFKEFGY